MDFFCSELFCIICLIGFPFDCRISRIRVESQYWIVLVRTNIQQLRNLTALLLVYHLTFIRGFKDDNFLVSTTLFTRRALFIWFWNRFIKGIGHVRWVRSLAGWMHDTPLWCWLLFMFSLHFLFLLFLQESLISIQILGLLMPLV